MDSLTQALLGGAIQSSILGKKQGRISIFYGALLGTLPDLDVILNYGDPVSNMTFHRGFSHSIFVLSILALILTFFIRKYCKNNSYTTLRFFITIWLVLITHPILDSFTIYGTQLFWPLSWTPESWSAIFIIDPIYTLPLLMAVIFFVFKGITNKSFYLINVSLVFSTSYLFFGLISRINAEYRAEKYFFENNVSVMELRAVPTPYNTLVWRIIAKTPDGYYIEAITSIFDNKDPEWIKLPRGLQLVSNLKENGIHQRLKWFTDDWLRYDLIDDKIIVSDLRMGIPTLYTFRFEIAQCKNSGKVINLTPKVWFSRMANIEEIKIIFYRIFYQQPVLPLSEWAQKNLNHPKNIVQNNCQI